MHCTISRLRVVFASGLMLGLVACAGEPPQPLPTGGLPSGQAQTATLAEGTGSIVETLSKSGQHQTFLRALDRSGLATQVERQGTYTVLAPTDAAFAELGAETQEWLFDEANRAKLVELVTNHLLRGRVPESTLRQPPENLETIAGNGLNIVVDRDIWVGAARVALPAMASENGIVYAIDRVLLPL